MVTGASFLKFVLLLLAFLLTLSPLIAHADRQTIIVRDASDPAWSEAVAETVAAFNAVMPESGPLLVYQRTTASCTRGHRRTIHVCSGPVEDTYGSSPWKHGDRYGSVLLSSTIVPPDPAGLRVVVCHEMMHALTLVPDNYHARPDDSCVWGYLDHPGAFDVSLLQQRFGAPTPPPSDSHKKHKKDHHKHHGSNHHHHS